MNKAELDALTKHESTPEEYDAIERLYLLAPEMTKEDAARVWRRYFLDAARKREAAYARPANGRELCDALAADVQRHPLAGRTRRITIRSRLYRFKAGYRYDNVYGCEEVLAVSIARGTEKTRWVGNFWPTHGAFAITDEYKAAIA